MEKTFRITIEGRAYVVTVEDITAEGEQRLYPEPGSMKVQPSEPSPPPAAGPADTAPAAAAEPGDEVAPMAGVVKAVHVTVGQHVAEGDKLLDVEAMKMVTQVLATRAGTVDEIAVASGDPVEAGQRLLRLT